METNETPVRTIITTDPELDDLNSMLRLLLYSNEIDIAGLVYTSSQYHYAGDAARAVVPYRWPDPGSEFHIDVAVNAYAKVWENLCVHDRRYPTPAYLRSVIRWGNVDAEGDVGRETPGSRLIAEEILRGGDGKLFLQAWGGTNTIARALMSIEEQYSRTAQWDALYARVSERIVITSFGEQDGTMREYIRPRWGDIETRDVATSTWGYTAWDVVHGADAQFLRAQWILPNISRRGPMGAEYRVWGDGKQMAGGRDLTDFFGLCEVTEAQLRAEGFDVWTPLREPGSWISEGDSSNFALLIRNGLRGWEDATWGSWGGRQVPTDAGKRSYSSAGVAESEVSRWFAAVQNDYAARLQWSVSPRYDVANHAPSIDVDCGTSVEAEPGDSIVARTQVSDPDGDEVEIHWWIYPQVGTYPGEVLWQESMPGVLSLQVPRDAVPGQTIHMIAEAIDHGTPPLTSYERLVIHVR